MAKRMTLAQARKRVEVLTARLLSTARKLDKARARVKRLERQVRTPNLLPPDPKTLAETFGIEIHGRKKG